MVRSVNVRFRTLRILIAVRPHTERVQPEMSALKFVKKRKRKLMSVMAETHQSAMGPYFAMAEAAFELNSVTAVFREALLGKVSTMQACVGSEGEVEGGGGEGQG